MAKRQKAGLTSKGAYDDTGVKWCFIATGGAAIAETVHLIFLGIKFTLTLFQK